MNNRGIAKAALCATSCLTLLAGAPALAQPVASAAGPAVEEAPEGTDIVVIGSRGKPRTDVDRPVAVDVVSATELRSTGQTDLGQQLQFTSPSFNSSKFGINGATNFADPATLRGMSPDQVLLLLNGKRRHQFSALNLNVAPGLGTVVSDLNAIPSAAIQRIEVLRDGAAAQYGSDAIAGVVNLALNNQDHGGLASATTGINREGDGLTFKLSLNTGMKLGGNGGFINATLEFFAANATNRSDPYDGVLYPTAPVPFVGPTPAFPYATANPRADRGVYPAGPFIVGNYGSNRNRTYQAFVNSELPLSEAVTAYAFGGYSRKDIQAFGFFRAPATNANSALTIFPDGYVPILPGRSIDWSAVGGLKGELGGWDMDLSYSYGHNHLDQNALNTVNASLGAASPTSFYVGQTEFNQQIVELSGSRQFDGALGMKSLNVASGLQWRRDNFQVHRGDPASYAVGPLVTAGKAAGSNGRPGYAPQDENNLSRTNVAAYIDLEADISDALLVTGALRYEKYSDFGGNLSGKLAGRYRFNENLALRGSYNRGFRAPSLAQIGNRVNTSTVQNGQILQTQQISSDDARLTALGIPQPKAEISDGYAVGLTGSFGNLTVTVDGFQINIRDRIAITDGLLAASYPTITSLFPGVREIRFFTNQIDTRTRGVDVVATYKVALESGSRLTFTLAGSHAETKVLRQRPTPAALIVGASAANQAAPLLGLTAIELIEVAQPRTKLVLSTTLETGPFVIGLRGTYFGSVKAFSTGLSASDPNVQCNSAGRCVQNFRAKMPFDLNVTWNATDKLALTVGANNIFNTYPDKWNARRNSFIGEAASYSNGQTPYTRNAGQFGFNGSYYYVTANLNF
jgi:iron complex outermembrane receptor protein